MITAIFNPGDKSITTEKLLQWDYGQVLSIKGLDLPKAVEIHFCVYTDSTTITTVGITTDDHTDVEIPDGLLQQERELRAYVYVADLEQGKTVRTVNIPIQSRQKPEIPHTPEDAEIFRKAIKAVNDSADRAETAANTSEQNAKKTAEDRTAIEEMVETVSGIEQQVQDVKKYAGKAETAASNAALSEQKAKESETATLQAKADAETAKGSAETAAGKTAEDKTAVERAKEEVLQAKQQVSADRAAVEAVQRNVAQMGNAIPQAVLEGVQAVKNAGAAEKQGIVQAGTEQKSAVESTGTKAVEDINLAKKTATDAVETAKTGAVGAVGTAGIEQTRNVTAEGEKQVKAVADKGNEVLQSIPEDFVTQMQNKLDKQQGAENAGKAMVINPEGLIVPGEVTGGDGIPIINDMSGESPLVLPDSAERVNKGLNIIGNTVQNQDPPPSPDNPQEIKNVGKWNPETQKYEVDVRVTGKNLLNQELLKDESNFDKTIHSQGYWQYFIYLNPNTKYTVSRKNKDEYQTGKSIKISTVKNSVSGQWLMATHAAIENKQSVTLTTPDTGLISINFLVGDINGVNETLKIAGYLQIECGEMASDFEPYKEQTLTLTSDRPITKWDKLVEQDGQIGWLYKSEIDTDVKPSRRDIFPYGFSLYKNHGNGTHTYVATNIKKVIGLQTSYCKQFLNKDAAYQTTELWHYSDQNSMQTQYFNVDIETKEAFVGWMENNPLTMVFKTNDSEFVPLQRSEQDAIRALKTYYPTTVITADGGEVIPSVELTYTADTKNFILNREKAMQEQMLNIQNAMISQKISGGGIKVTDSSRLPVEEFVMSGKTEQLQSTGKNLISVPDIEAGSTQQNIPCLLEKDVYISCHEKTAKVSGDIWRIRIMFKDKSSKYLTDSQMEGGNKFVCDTENPIIGIAVRGNNIESGAYRKIQVEYGSAKTSYEPYTGGKPTPSPDNPQPIETTPQGIVTVDFTDGTNHQTVELNCPREFTKWDRLEKIDGIWNWVFGSKKVMLNGSEVWSKYADDFVYTIKIDDAKPGYQRSYCDKFKNVDAAFSDKYKSSSWIHSDHPTLKIKYFRAEPSLSTVELWKEWLNKNKAELIYGVDEPELIPLSPSEQDKLNALTMYAPNTEITNTGGCNMELTYTVDTKSYVDAKIASVVKSVVETQKALL